MALQPTTLRPFVIPTPPLLFLCGTGLWPVESANTGETLRLRSGQAPVPPKQGRAGGGPARLRRVSSFVFRFSAYNAGLPGGHASVNVLVLGSGGRGRPPGRRIKDQPAG